MHTKRNAPNGRGCGMRNEGSGENTPPVNMEELCNVLSELSAFISRATIAGDIGKQEAVSIAGYIKMGDYPLTVGK